MANLVTNSSNQFSFENPLVITKQSGTNVLLSTENTFVNKNISLNFDVQTATVAAGTSSASITLESTDSSSINGKNIYGVMLDPVDSEPSSGYYLRIKADGAGRTNVTRAGWISSGQSTNSTATVTKFYPITPGSATITASGSLSNPTLAKSSTTISGKTSINSSVSAPQTSNSISTTYYIALQASEADSTVSLSKSVGAQGYLDNVNQITANDFTLTGKNSTYYIPVPGAGKSNAATGSATISDATFTYNTTNENFDVSGSASITGTATLTVSSAGWLPKTNVTGSTTGTATLATTVNKIGIGASLSGSKVTPVISKHNNTNIPNTGAAVTSQPSSGYYIAVQTAAITNNITATPSVISNGYGTTTLYNSTNASGDRGANASSVTYFTIPTASLAAGNGSVALTAGNGSCTFKDATNVTTSTTNNGIYVRFDGKGTVSGVGSGTVSVETAGYIPVGTSLGSNNSSSSSLSSNTATGTIYITGITVPKDKPFTLTTTADTALDDTSDITITNGAYRWLKITNGGSTVINNNRGDITVKSNESSYGTVRVNAYNNAATPALTGNQTVVSNGKWNYNTVTANANTQGPYYGATYVNPISSGTAASISSEGSVTTAPSVTISGTTNMETANSGTYYFTRTGVASNGTVQTKWKNATAGYAAQNTSGTNSGTVTVTPTKTADATIYIPTAIGSVTMSAGSGVCTYDSTNSSHVTVSDTNTSGVAVVFKGKGSVSATAKITTAGYTPINNSFATGSSTSSNETSLTKYITGVELTAGKTFSITVPNGNSTDKITFVFTVDNNYNVTVDGG